MKKLIFLLLLIPSLLFAQQQEAYMMQGVVGGVPPSGCTSPASGTVIVGTSTTDTTTTRNPEANEGHFFNVDFTATWAETCTTTTMATIEVYTRGNAGGNCKAYITDSSGIILTNGISNPKAFVYAAGYDWRVFTMGTPPTLTKGTAYRLAWICDTQYAIAFPFNSAGTITFCRDTGGSYTTPANLTCTAVDLSATECNIRGKK